MCFCCFLARQLELNHFFMYFTIIYFMCEHVNDFCVDRKMVDHLQNNMHNTFLSNFQYSDGVVEAFCFP